MMRGALLHRTPGNSCNCQSCAALLVTVGLPGCSAISRTLCGECVEAHPPLVAGRGAVRRWGRSRLMPSMPARKSLKMRRLFMDAGGLSGRSSRKLWLTLRSRILTERPLSEASALRVFSCSYTNFPISVESFASSAMLTSRGTPTGLHARVQASQRNHHFCLLAAAILGLPVRSLARMAWSQRTAASFALAKLASALCTKESAMLARQLRCHSTALQALSSHHRRPVTGRMDHTMSRAGSTCGRSCLPLYLA